MLMSKQIRANNLSHQDAWSLLEPLLVELARLVLHVLHQAQHLHRAALMSRLRHGFSTRSYHGGKGMQVTTQCSVSSSSRKQDESCP